MRASQLAPRMVATVCVHESQIGDVALVCLQVEHNSDRLVPILTQAISTAIFQTGSDFMHPEGTAGGAFQFVVKRKIDLFAHDFLP